MKTSRNAIIWLSVLLFLAIVFVPSADAQFRRPWRANAGAVDLTDEQFDRIDQIRLDFQNEILPLEAKWRKLDLELEAMSRKGQNLDTKLKDLESLELEMDKMWEKHQDKVRSVLTDDQKVLFDRFGGLGQGWGPGWGMGTGAGRGMGYGWAPGMGRANRGYGMYGRYGRGYGAGMGRGYFCPWRRW